MVMDLIDIEPKELKKAQKVLNALFILGISQNDLLNIFKEVETLKQRNEELEDRLQKAEEYIRLQKIADTRQVVQVSGEDNNTKTVAQNMQKFLNSREEFYPYGKPTNK